MQFDANNIDQLKIVIRKCLKRDPRFQKSLYEKFSLKMFGVCLRYAKDRSTAEDFLQEGFVKIFANLDKYRFEGSFEGWIRRIMINVCIEYVKKNIQIVYMNEYAEIGSLSVHNDGYKKLASDDLMKIIQKMPDGYRTVFNLYAIEGYSHKEIAEMLNISEGTSKSQLARSRQLLQNIISKKDKQIYEPVIQSR